MNFLKTFYLVATLLGCVNLAAMQEVPSDEEVKASITNILKMCEEKLQDNAEKTRVLKCLLLDSKKGVNPGNQAFIEWINAIIKDGNHLDITNHTITECPLIAVGRFNGVIGDMREQMPEFDRRCIIITTETLKKLSLPELRFVLAHEIGHIAHQHIQKKNKFALGASILAGIAAGTAMELCSNASMLKRLAYAGLSVGMSLLAIYPIKQKLSRHYEYEADNFAALVIKDEQACECLRKINDELPLKYKILQAVGLASHPTDNERIARMQATIRKLKNQVKQ